jgi:hypothetical protein
MGLGRPGERRTLTDFIIARDGRIAAVYLFSTSYPELKGDHFMSNHHHLPTE